MLTRYGVMGASSRQRMLIFRPWLEQAGVHVDVHPFFDENYLHALYGSGRARWRDIVRAYGRRLHALLELRRYDLIWLEKELFPFLPGSIDAMLVHAGVPYVLDYDDATFHRYDLHRSGLVRAMLGRRLMPLMRGARMVTAGNAYLADYARRAGATAVRVFPTVVDRDHYSVSPDPVDDPLRIGWIGSPTTAKYLELVRQPLQELVRERSMRLVVIGAREIPDIKVPMESHSWSAETESALLGTLHVGIMPLPDGPWERGKCGYKLIQYMACGKPVIASPVGVNADIITPQVGNLAENDGDWLAALRALSADAELRHKLGHAGRTQVEVRYSVQAVAPHLVETLGRAAEGSS